MMMLPVTLLPTLKTFWLQSKWVLILSAATFWSYACYNYGRESVLKAQVKQESKAVVQAQKDGKKAVERAEADVRRIFDLEKANAELLKKFDEIPDRVKCPISDDELRILTEAANATK